VAPFEGREALLLGGAVQSVTVDDETEPSGYWPALLPNERPRRTLLLGLGGGTVVRLLQRRFPGEPLAVTGVDDDPRVLMIARERFGLDLPGLTVVQADALAYLERCRAGGERFDLVVVDLFRDGAVPEVVCSRRFLGLVAAALAVDGMMTINLNRGERRVAQLRRLGRRFVLHRLVATGMNLVVHARPRERRQYRRRP
jgi:spermidine synthase